MAVKLLTFFYTWICTCWWWTVETSALEQADIFVVIVQPLLERIDEGSFTMYSGKEFQLLTTLWEKQNFLVSRLQYLMYSFRLWPLKYRSESVKWKNVSLLTFSFSDRILYVSSRSPLILHLSNDHYLRSSTGGDFIVRRIRTRVADSLFTVAGPAAWNSLPARIRNIDSHYGFCRQLKITCSLHLVDLFVHVGYIV